MPLHLVPRAPRVLALLAAAALATAADAASGYQFSTPAGWSRADQGDTIFLVPSSEPRGSAVLMILPAIARQPDLDAQFTSLRTGLEAGLKLRQLRAPSLQRASGPGFETRRHVATYSSDQGDRRVAVMARAEGQLVGTVVFFTTSAAAYERLRGVAAQVFDGLRLIPAAASQPVTAAMPAVQGGGAAPPTPAGAMRSGPDAVGVRGGGIAGVWMGMVTLWGTGRYTPEPRWKVFFDDGSMYADLPSQGLAGFDRAAYRATNPMAEGYWHTYTFAGSSGESRRPGTTSPWKLRVEKPGQLRVDDDTFYRCASVDGLRLHGAWTSYSEPNDPRLDTLPIGQRPVIHFTRDGRFTDDGLFAVFIKSSGDDRPGAGRYELRDFTLVLRYDDGRERREAFTGLLGARVDQQDGMVYLRRSLLTKRASR